jgi:tryptophan synthase alpha chain
MNRIDRIFASAREERRAALMPYITGGYPNLETTAAVIPMLEQAGADIVEIGFPFSDPIADGPVIAASMHEALAAGATPTGIFDVIHRLRSETSLGLVAMVSDSIVRRMERPVFLDQCRQCGLDGLIVPDIDLNDASECSKLATDRGLSFSLLVAPTTAESRIDQITRLCSGFVYVLARVGTTGERRELPDLRGYLDRIRRKTKLPLAVGFGVSTAEQVAQVGELADGVIVGSALVRRMSEGGDAAAAAREFVSQLARPFRAATATRQ